jgi:hypothetical protein
MVQPKKPPVSLRIPDATKAAVEQFATERKIPRNAAYVELLQRGLKTATGAGVPRSKPEAGKPIRPAAKVVSPEPAPQRYVRQDTYPDWMKGKK